jgi:dTDP-glucose 4,6-dehydratase
MCRPEKPASKARPRPGHDPHYGLDTARITALGWKPPVPFAEPLQRTVAWAIRHPEWLAG